jgi:hypothetical protein
MFDHCATASSLYIQSSKCSSNVYPIQVQNGLAYYIISVITIVKIFVGLIPQLKGIQMAFVAYTLTVKLTRLITYGITFLLIQTRHLTVD